MGIFVFNLANPGVKSVAVVVAPLQTPYLVAAHALPAGTLIRDDDIKPVMIDTSKLPPGAFVDSPDARIDLRGSLVREFVDMGKPVFASDVLRPRDRGFIASVLEAGSRAVAISVDPVSGVAGLIWPGDHVDIILTQEIDKATAGRRALGETILTNIRVIAIDQEMVQGAPSDSTTAGRTTHTVTVQVDPTQVEQLAVASRLGKLTLSIRAAVDQATIISDRTTYGLDVSPALHRADKPETGNTIVIFEGTTRKEVTFP
jgi:pilus assembly protein CpaB